MCTKKINEQKPFNRFYNVLLPPVLNFLFRFLFLSYDVQLPVLLAPIFYDYIPILLPVLVTVCVFCIKNNMIKLNAFQMHAFTYQS